MLEPIIRCTGSPAQPHSLFSIRRFPLPSKRLDIRTDHQTSKAIPSGYRSALRRSHARPASPARDQRGWCFTAVLTQKPLQAAFLPPAGEGDRNGWREFSTSAARKFWIKWAGCGISRAPDADLRRKQAVSNNQLHTTKNLDEKEKSPLDLGLFGNKKV